MLKRIIKNILIGNIDLEKQQLSKDTINILAVINYRYWVKSEEHKKWLLSQYKKNEELNRNIEIKELFLNKDHNPKINNNSELVVIKKDSLFKKMINFIKGIIK